MVGRPPAVGLPSCLHAATGMEEVGWWGDPREGFILTKPYMARRHVRQTKLPGVREQLGFTHKPYKYGTRHVRQHFFFNLSRRRL